MRFSVLQWNIWFQEDIKNVLNFLKHQNADILCLQELTIGCPMQSQINTCEFLAESLGYYLYYHDIPIITSEAEWLQANAILSRYPIVKTNAEWVYEPKAEDGYHDQHRAYIEAQIEIGDKIITFATVHMSFIKADEDARQKVQEADRLISIISEREGPYILTGDLNALPGSYEINELSKHLAHAGPDFNETTWASKKFGGAEPDRRLDYIFYDGPQLIDSQIIETEASDHEPIIANFKIEDLKSN